MKPDGSAENSAFCAGIGAGWGMAVLTLVVWAGVPLDIAGRAMALGLVPCVVGVWLEFRRVWRAVAETQKDRKSVDVGENS
jgi:hypothetical protein